MADPVDPNDPVVTVPLVDAPIDPNPPTPPTLPESNLTTDAANQAQTDLSNSLPPLQVFFAPLLVDIETDGYKLSLPTSFITSQQWRPGDMIRVTPSRNQRSIQIKVE